MVCICKVQLECIDLLPQSLHSVCETLWRFLKALSMICIHLEGWIEIKILLTVLLIRQWFLLYLHNYIRSKYIEVKFTSTLISLLILLCCIWSLVDGPFMYPSNTEHYWGEYVHTGCIAGWDQHMNANFGHGKYRSITPPSIIYTPPINFIHRTITSKTQNFKSSLLYYRSID